MMLMYVTHRYLGIQRGRLKYLFLLLTEDYIEENRTIRGNLRPLLENFGRTLAGHGAVVLPFRGTEDDNLGDILKKGEWNQEQVRWMRDNLPGILIINCDVSDFNPEKDPFIIVSIRQSLDDYGNVKVFEIAELLKFLAENAADENLFANSPPELLAMQRADLWSIVEAKPGIYGFGIDLASALGWLKNRRFLSHQYV
jgi:hypothetical protein